MVKQISNRMQLTDDGFNEMFEAQIKLHPTYRAAYESVEVFHELLFGKRRYSDFKSFETVRNRKIKSVD